MCQNTGISSGLQHFLDLARRGRPNTGASGDEIKARKLAKAIVEYAAGLDQEAVEGAAEFLRSVPTAPTLARQLVDV